MGTSQKWIDETINLYRFQDCLLFSGFCFPKNPPPSREKYLVKTPIPKGIGQIRGMKNQNLITE